MAVASSGPDVVMIGPRSKSFDHNLISDRPSPPKATFGDLCRWICDFPGCASACVSADECKSITSSMSRRWKEVGVRSVGVRLEVVVII